MHLPNFWHVSAGKSGRDYSDIFLEHDVMFIGPGDGGPYSEEAYGGEDHDPRIWAGWYEVTIPPGLPSEERRLAVRRHLVASLKGHAELYLLGRLADVSEQARVDPPSLIVREQRRRWGSCDANGTLRINWRIIQAPTPLIDYVLAHELVHLTHREHGPEFWATLGRRMPDYEDRRRRLRILGPSLEW